MSANIDLPTGDLEKFESIEKLDPSTARHRRNALLREEFLRKKNQTITDAAEETIQNSGNNLSELSKEKPKKEKKRRKEKKKEKKSKKSKSEKKSKSQEKPKKPRHVIITARNFFQEIVKYCEEHNLRPMNQANMEEVLIDMSQKHYIFKTGKWMKPFIHMVLQYFGDKSSVFEMLDSIMREAKKEL